MLSHSLQDVDEVGVRVDAVQPASRDQALNDSDLLGAHFRPAEEPRLSSLWNDTQGALQMVRVHGDIGITEKNLQPRTPLAHIVQRLRERAARQQSLFLELLVHPVEERIHAACCVSADAGVCSVQ